MAALLLLVSLAGCGGVGGGSASVPSVDARLFVPNYIPSLPGLYHWNHLPINVSFVLPGNWQQLYPTNPNLHIDAANEWNQRGRQVMVTVIPSVQPDVVVTFVAQSTLGENALGLTYYTYDTTGRMISAAVKVARDDWQGNTIQADDAQSIIAHELGHALGIGGHSPNVNDLMYPSHTMGILRGATELDRNTVMSAYSAYFGRAIPFDRGIESRAIPEIRTGVIE